MSKNREKQHNDINRVRFIGYLQKNGGRVNQTAHFVGVILKIRPFMDGH
ncbi:MAG: hypothetical protein ACC707_19200 [Thiohalomonadales bacterium]